MRNSSLQATPQQEASSSRWSTELWAFNPLGDKQQRGGAGCMIGQHLSLTVQRNVGHLLAGVEQSILGALGEHILGCTNQHRCIQGREADLAERPSQR